MYVCTEGILWVCFGVATLEQVVHGVSFFSYEGEDIHDVYDEHNLLCSFCLVLFLFQEGWELKLSRSFLMAGLVYWYFAHLVMVRCRCSLVLCLIS